MSYAVIRMSGRQFKVSLGDKFSIQKAENVSPEVLMYSDGTELKVGQPVLNDVEIELQKIEDKRERKIRVGRYKSKSRYRRVKGHRQHISVFEVVSLGGKKAAPKKEKAEVKEEPKEVKTKEVEVKTEKKVTKEEPKETPKKSVKTETKEKKAPKKRGRPKKTETVKDEPKKKRGRPSKKKES